MQFVKIPTEQTTAITDILLAMVAGILIILIWKKCRQIDPKKTLIWVVAFGFLAVAATLGAIAHGFEMSMELNTLIWYPINLFLGFTVAFFTAGVIYDINRYGIAGYVIVILILSSLLFFVVTIIIPNSFLIFILYEAVAMFFALFSYMVLAVRRKLKGAWLMSSGILLSILASAIQATGSFHFIMFWEFNHNGIFHLIQIPGLYFLYAGIKYNINYRHSSIK